MSNKEYIIWENTWRYRILEVLEKGRVDWDSLRKDAKLSPHALNKSLASLQQSKIVQKTEKDEKIVYEICGEYTIISQKETETVSEEVKKEEIVENLLTKVEVPSEDPKPII